MTLSLFTFKDACESGLAVSCNHTQTNVSVTHFRLFRVNCQEI